jgi:hypothetical protein
MGIPEPRWNTRSPLGLGLRLYFLSPLGIGMGLGKPELYGFEFGESKTRPRSASLPCLLTSTFPRQYPQYHSHVYPPPTHISFIQLIFFLFNRLVNLSTLTVLTCKLHPFFFNLFPFYLFVLFLFVWLLFC